MRIAIPVENNELAKDYSASSTFAVYDVDDETRRVSYVGREVLGEFGCARTPVELRKLEVEMVIGHHLSQNAVNQLLEYGILAAKDAPLMGPDAIMAHLVSGTLQATSPDPAMHRAPSCGSGGCEHCTNHD